MHSKLVFILFNVWKIFFVKYSLITIFVIELWQNEELIYLSKKTFGDTEIDITNIES
jgi:hypothetical protein